MYNLDFFVGRVDVGLCPEKQKESGRVLELLKMEYGCDADGDLCGLVGRGD